MERKIEVLGFYDGYNLLDGEGKKIDPLRIIELAGKTCYKSFDKITADSAKQFVHKLLRVYKHESVIEHSWFLFLMRSAGPFSYGFIKDFLVTKGLLKISRRENNDYLISGNARMFRDYFAITSNSRKYDLLNLLTEKYPDLFNDFKINKNIIRDSSPIFSLNPDIEYTKKEKLKHFWLAIRFKGGSRAFTHQLARHRICAISQESQRYCDESGFYDNDYYVIPDSILELDSVKIKDLIGDGSIENDLTLKEWYKTNMLLIDSWYRQLQDFLKLAKEKGLTKAKVNEDARFLLPNAVCSEIVVSANLEEWRHISKMRCDTHAQWEIRNFAMMVLKKAKTLFPGIFNDFQENNDEKSAFLTI